jgi:glycosyltransferase involved in cell wall biosynthesis
MHTLLAIPCYNEAGRLPSYLPALLEQIASSGLPVTVEVVDDGSQESQRAATDRLVTELRSSHPFLLPLRALPHNVGKGAAVRAAWDAAVESHEWLAFVDADGSLSPAETCRFLDHCLRQTNPHTCFASRIQMMGRSVDRHIYRHLSGRIFATMVGTLIDRHVYDSQCGLKALPSAHYRTIRPLLRENRFIFDVELLASLLHAKLPVREIPVDWADVPGSKVRPIRDTLGMARGLLRIHRRRRGWPALQVSSGL